MSSNPNKRILLSYPHMSGDELRLVKDAFESNRIVPLGPSIDAFEKETAEYAGAKAASAVSSGSAVIYRCHHVFNAYANCNGSRVDCNATGASASFVAGGMRVNVARFLQNNETPPTKVPINGKFYNYNNVM